jgi:two-component system, NtrC family, sensor kinase
MDKISNTLFFRLFIILLIVMVISLGSYAYFTIKAQETHLTSVVISNANRISDFIKGSTRYGMLLNRREDTHQTILRLGEEPGIEFIRIMNKKGGIIYSNLDNEIGKTVDMTAEACFICHSQKKPIESIPDVSRTRIIVRPDGHRSLCLINPIRNEPDCANADCHAHPANTKILGVLDVKISLDQVDSSISEAQNQIIIFSAVLVFLINFVSALFIRKVVHKPVRKLIAGTSAISGGDLMYRIDINSKTEIGALANAFNIMTHNLKTAHDEIKDWSESLEKKVEEKSLELKRAQAHLIQIEKMASLGQLSATVAHELNNPLEGILTFAKLQVKRLQKTDLTKEKITEIIKDLNFLIDESARCGNIVKNLLIFSKQHPTEFKEANIETIIEKSIMLVAHHMQMRSMQLIRDYNVANPLIVCSSPQLQQAFVALLINSIEAIVQKGTITVKISDAQLDEIRIDISDSGQGMSQETRDHIFEPFFTTKVDGKGVGLGLSVVYGIIENHNGNIEVESEIDKGTTFHISIPRQRKESGS